MSGDPGGGPPGPGGPGYEMPERRRTHAAVIVVAVLTVLTVFVGIAAATLAPLFVGRAGPVTAWGAWWCGDGAFVVAQLRDGNGVPRVVAWDRESGEARVRDRLHVVAVEPDAPRVWLVPDDAGGSLADSGAEELPDLAGDARDSPPRRLLLWDLASGEPPGDDADSRWAPWPGDGYVAFAEIDALAGALPSKLLFQPASGRTEGVTAALPGAVTTFEPLGWSASGEYFAIYALGSERPQAMLLDPATGSVVASAAADPEPRSGFGLPAVWSPEADELVWASGGLAHSLSPDRGYTTVASIDIEPAYTLGAGPAGVLAYLPRRPGVYAVVGASRDAPLVGDTGKVAGIAFSASPGLAFVRGDSPRLLIGPVEGEYQVVWQAPK